MFCLNTKFLKILRILLSYELEFIYFVSNVDTTYPETGNNIEIVCFVHQGLMHLPGRPVAAFDPEGLIFAAGINSECLKLYDLRSFDKVSNFLILCLPFATFY